MAKESFIIYTKYGEQINLLSDTQAGVLLRALIKYQIGEELPKMDGMTNLVFSVIRQQMDFDNNKYDEMCKARSNAGKQGGRPAKPLENKGNKTKKANALNDKAKKPNAFLGFDEKAKKAEYEYDNDNDNEYDIITPIIPYEGNGDSNREKFFKTYPSFRGEKRCDDSGVDYAVLLAEFEKSRVLRGMYSFAKVCGMYDAIARGDFRDKESNPSTASSIADADAKAERERFYSLRRHRAIAEAEKVHKRFMKDETYAKNYNRLRKIEIEQGNAEAQGQMDIAAELEREKGRLRVQQRGIIERNGLTEEDLEPKWMCRKCKDTGFVEGIPCDCYEG